MNKNINLQNTALVLILLLFSLGSHAQADTASPLGLEFGISKDDAKKQIKSSGLNIVKNEVDTKEIRTLKFAGVLTELPVERTDNAFTELEFFDDKLMTSAVSIDNTDADFENYQDSFIDYLINKHGKPYDSEKMFNYRVWTWDLSDTKLVFSTNSDKKSVKLSYTFKPINQKRIAREIREKRQGEKKNPADQMFKDGNYSRPSNFPR